MDLSPGTLISPCSIDEGSMLIELNVVLQWGSVMCSLGQPRKSCSQYGKNPARRLQDAVPKILGGRKEIGQTSRVASLDAAAQFGKAG